LKEKKTLRMPEIQKLQLGISGGNGKVRERPQLVGVMGGGKTRIEKKQRGGNGKFSQKR